MPFQTLNPATEVAQAAYDFIDNQTLDKHIQKASEAFEEWRKKGFEGRKAYFESLINLLEHNQEAYAQTITTEVGKPIKQARGEIDKCAWVCRYYADNAADFLADKPKNLETTQESYTQFPPLGVLYAVMPWNFPFWQLFRFAAPALMAGNTFLLKHAPNVPESALKIEALFQEAGFPEGCFQNLFINYEQSDKLIAHPTVQGVTFTGSKHGGSQVAKQAGAHVKKSVLELGGSDPFIVLPDADSAMAAKTAATARLQNTGQSCIASKRFIVTKDNAEEFLDHFKAAFEAFKIGDPTAEDTDLGPLAREDIRATLEEQVTDAVNKGARLIIGRERIDGDGYFFEPTIITGITSQMRIYHEEVFGPVAAVYVVEDEAEAIQLANDTPYGLGATIWSADITKAKAMAEALNAGGVAINGLLKSDPRMPFGGVKASGYGRELSEFGIKEFVNIKAVNVF